MQWLLSRNHDAERIGDFEPGVGNEGVVVPRKILTISSRRATVVQTTKRRHLMAADLVPPDAGDHHRAFLADALRRLLLVWVRGDATSGEGDLGEGQQAQEEDDQGEGRAAREARHGESGKQQKRKTSGDSTLVCNWQKHASSYTSSEWEELGGEVTVIKRRCQTFLKELGNAFTWE